MHRFPFGDDVVDGLLSGSLPADQVPDGYRGVAALFGAATAAAAPAELARTAAITASAAATVQQSIPSLLTPPSRRTSVIKKLLTAKAAAGATVLAFGLGTTAAAATGAIPGLSHANHHASVGLAIAAGHADSTTSSSTSPTTAAPAKSTSPSSLPATGPANVHAQFGLCTAFLNGQKHSTPSSTTSLPPQYSSTAFQALINEHGGVASTTTYCQGLQKPGGSGNQSGGKPAAAGKSASHDTSGGKPADAGPPTSLPGKASSHS